MTCKKDLAPAQAFVEWLEPDDAPPREIRVYCMGAGTTGHRSSCARHVGKADAKYVAFTSSNRPRVP